MLKVKHVLVLGEGLLDLLIGPIDEEFIVEVGFLS
jgi:hypothetical protein